VLYSYVQNYRRSLERRKESYVSQGLGMERTYASQGLRNRPLRACVKCWWYAFATSNLNLCCVYMPITTGGAWWRGTRHPRARGSARISVREPGAWSGEELTQARSLMCGTQGVMAGPLNNKGSYWKNSSSRAASEARKIRANTTDGIQQ